MALKQYSLSEISQHNDKTSTWTIIDDKVYDVTKFLIEHPGGEETLLEVAGKDGTDGFKEAGHSADAREMKEEYLVGEVVEAERKQTKKKEEEEAEKKKCVKCAYCVKFVVLPFAVGLLVTLLYRVYRSHH